MFSFTQSKHALVIGNGAYTNITPLNNPVNDANDMETALRALALTVEKVLNGSQDQMVNAVMQLKRRLRTFEINTWIMKAHGSDLEKFKRTKYRIFAEFSFLFFRFLLFYKHNRHS